VLGLFLFPFPVSCLLSAVNFSIPTQEKTMKNEKINAVQVWKQMEDLLAPQLHFFAG